MIQPRPLKYVCPECGYSKIIKPKSDALNPMNLITTCPKCGAYMEMGASNAIKDTLFDVLKGLFTKK